MESISISPSTPFDQQLTGDRINARRWLTFVFGTLIMWGLYFVWRPPLPMLWLRNSEILGRSTNHVAITIDDAPHPLSTPLLLASLHRAGVKASFFCIGEGLRHYPELAYRIAAEGHLLENHSLSHHNLTTLTPNAYPRQIDGCFQQIEATQRAAAITHPTTLFRPPGGGLDRAEMNYLYSKGYALAWWSNNVGDWVCPPAWKIATRVKAGLKPGDIILLHDGGTGTPQAIPNIVKWARDQGMQFVLMPEVQDSNGPDYGSDRNHTIRNRNASPNRRPIANHPIFSEAMKLNDVLSGYSLALYSNWFLYQPDRILIDCGEGCATALGNRCFTIQKVCLTHGHIDHIAGLPSLVWARAAGMGDNEKPLDIYYPRGDAFLEDMIVFLEKTRARVPYPLAWHPLEAGESIELRGGRRLETFPTRHVKNGPSLGYKVIEARKRRKIEFADLVESELRARAQSGTIEEVMERYEATLIAFGGDSLPLEPALVRDADVLLHEATILNPEDLKGQNHSTLEEAIEVAQRACPKLLVLIHVSVRYRKAQIENAVRECATRRALEFPIWCLFRDQLWPIWEPETA